MNTKISKLFTVAALSGALVTSAAALSARADDTGSATPQNPQVQQDREALKDVRAKMKSEKEKIQADREQLKKDIASSGKDSPQVQADREKLKGDIAAKRELRKERHAARMKLHKERAEIRKAKKSAQQASGGSTENSQPSTGAPASQ